MSDPAPAEATAPAPAPRRRLPRPVLTAAALLLVLGGGGGAAWHFFLRAHHPAEAKEPAEKAPAHILKLGTMVVNVQGTEGRRYLRATVELGTGAKEVKRLEELRAPLVDTAIGVLGAKALPVLLQPGERGALRDELRTRLNEAIGGTGVSHVYLTEFVIQ